MRTENKQQRATVNVSIQQEALMTTVEILEVIYENGVLKPLERHGFKEHQRYRVIVEPLAS